VPHFSLLENIKLGFTGQDQMLPFGSLQALSANIRLGDKGFQEISQGNLTEGES
jgi:hypothetical protein